MKALKKKETEARLIPGKDYFLYSRDNDVPKLCNIDMSPSKVLRQDDNEREHGKVRGLNGKKTYIESALCPFYHCPKNKDRDERYEHNRVERSYRPGLSEESIVK